MTLYVLIGKRGATFSDNDLTIRTVVPLMKEWAGFRLTFSFTEQFGKGMIAGNWGPLLRVSKVERFVELKWKEVKEYAI